MGRGEGGGWGVVAIMVGWGLGGVYFWQVGGFEVLLGICLVGTM